MLISSVLYTVPKGVGDPLEGPFNCHTTKSLRRLDEARIGGYRARTAFSKSHLSGPTCHASRNIPSSVGNSLNTAATKQMGRQTSGPFERNRPTIARDVSGRHQSPRTHTGPPRCQISNIGRLPSQESQSAKLLNCVRIAHGPQGPST